MKRILSAMLAVVVVAGLVACGGGDANNTNGNTPDGNQTGQADKPAPKIPSKLIVTAIPDENAEKMREHYGLIAKAIGDATGIPCEYVHVQDYSASVTALATGEAHFAWFGAVTTAQARIRMKDDMVVVACRDIDKTFKSYYIGNAEAGVPKVKDLAELAKLATDNGWTLTYGSKSSTSSHMMPRDFFVRQSGTKPEDAFKSVSYSGAHDVVLQKVANGEYQVGALGEPQYDRASAELKAKAPIIYTTPPFTNYCMCARADLGDELIGKARKALFELGNTEEGKKVLKFLKAGKFIEADIKEWQVYVDLIEAGVDIGN